MASVSYVPFQNNFLSKIHIISNQRIMKMIRTILLNTNIEVIPLPRIYCVKCRGQSISFCMQKNQNSFKRWEQLIKKEFLSRVEVLI